ncbi:hypothetical protein [Luteimonas cucumeris]|uniref:hypothetical protein n=1 Tax=Luteimonas cucumeris TaxID=985012 RepID=UPI0013150F01|nr:hypothetical protein [Luteimonas cucumeris]
MNELIQPSRSFLKAVIACLPASAGLMAIGRQARSWYEDNDRAFRDAVVLVVPAAH